MSSKRTVATIYIRSDGKEIRETTADLHKLEDGLRNLDIAQAKETAETLSNLGHTNLKEIIHQVQDVKNATAGIDDKQIKEAQKSLKNIGVEAKETAQTYTDSTERMRDENDRFVKSASDTRNAVKSVGDETEKTARKAKSAGDSFKSFVGNLSSDLLQAAVGKIKQLVSESFKLDGTLDRLTRFTATLDKEFQSPKALKELRRDFEEIAPITGQAAEAIAKASFTVKSAYQDLSRQDLKEFLTEFGLAATGSNAQIDSHAEKVVALAKQYGITKGELREFSAMVASSFGQALGSDSQVAEGFNQLIVTARLAKIPLNDLIAAMATIQSTSSDAAGNTTNLQNAIAKLGDAKYIEGLKEVFNIERFNKADGSIKSLNSIINELAKSLEGLTDEQKLTRINSVFKDQQAVQGIMSLVNGVKEYNKQLANGADADAFQRKVDIMLGSTEARWAAFYSNIENQQRAFGLRYQEQLLNIFEQPNAGSGIEAFFINLGAEISTFFVKVAELIATGAEKVNGWLKSAVDSIFDMNFFFDGDAAQAQTEKGITDYYSGVYVSIENQRTARLSDIKDSNKKFYQEILVSPIADPTLKAQAQKSLDILNSAIGDSAKKVGKENFNVGENLKKGIEQSTPQAQQAAQKMGNETIQSLAQTVKQNAGIVTTADLIRPNVEAAIKAGNTSGTAFVDGTYKSIVAKQSEIEKAQKEAVQVRNPNYYLILGQSIGSNFGAGIYNGIGSWAGAIGAKVGSLVDKYMFGAAAKAQDSHSPSIRAEKEIGAMFSQGIALGVAREQQKIESAVVQTVGSAFKKAKKVADETLKELQEAYKAFDKIAGMNPAQVGRIIEADSLQQGANDIQEVIRLRQELRGEQGVKSVTDALPTSPGGAAAELLQLKTVQKIIKDNEKSYDDLRESVENLRLAELEEAADKRKLFEDRKKAVQDAGAADVLALSKEIELLGITDTVEKERIENAYELKALREQLTNDGFGEKQIQEAEDIMRVENARRLELTKLRSVKQQQIDEAKKLADEQKKVAEETQRQIEQIGQRIEDSLSNVLDGFRGGVKSGLRSIWQEIKGFSDDFLNGILKNLSQSIAKTVFGGSSSSSSSSSGGIFDLFKRTTSVGGTPTFAGNNYNSPNGILDGKTAEQALNFGGSGGSGNILSNLKNLFSTKEGGLFAARKNILTGEDSKWGGIIGGAGSIAQLLGGIIGGRAGGVLSSAGTGAQIGSMFGGIGAGVGAAIGAIVGIFGANKTRRNAETMRNQAMIETLNGLNQIKGALDGRPPTLDPTSGVNQAKEIQTSYFTAMAQLPDAKTAKIAKKDGDERVTPLVNAITLSADAAKAFNINRQNTSNNFVGEFASGGYMSTEFAAQYGEFKRRNGILPGAWTGKDVLPSMFAAGEMVLNPSQIAAVIANARAGDDDPFERAGVPGYQAAQPSPSTPQFNTGMSFAAPVASSNNSKQSDVIFGKDSIVINLNGKRVTDAEIELISINGNQKFMNTGGRRSTN